MPRALRVVVADDDPFITVLVTGALQAAGCVVDAANDPEEALRLLDRLGPDVLVSDLDFNAETSGIDLVRAARRRAPGLGVVMLTAHQDPQLAVADAELPDNVVYRVKSTLRGTSALYDAVLAAVGLRPKHTRVASPARVHALTGAQAEVLRLLAQGLSTRAIAERRGTSVRATELMLTRLYQALELETGQDYNPRVAAVRLWQQGAVGLTT